MMLVELKKEMVTLLKKCFGKKYQYYSMIVEEGFNEPCFFTEIEPREVMAANKNTMYYLVDFIIEYRPAMASEVDFFEKINQMKKAIGNSLAVKDRHIHITEFSWDYIGKKRDVLEITITFEWFEQIEKEEVAEKMEEVIFEKIEMEG